MTSEAKLSKAKDMDAAEITKYPCLIFLFRIISVGRARSSESMTSEAKLSKAKVMDAAECTEYPCLIFEDNFDSLDLDVWQHEISMSGGGVCITLYFITVRVQ